jgi:hypothetical protein
LSERHHTSLPDSGKSMFSIETDTIMLPLEIVPVDSLLQHEEILPELVEKLVLAKTELYRYFS